MTDAVVTQTVTEKTTTIIKAHTQTETVTIRRYFPDHTPRADDPHYHYFNAARKRLHDAGKLICWVCGKGEGDPHNPIELHHTMVEYAIQNAIDIPRFEEAYPEFGIMSDEDFFRWVEQDDKNLTALCMAHHTGLLGIHRLDGPTWNGLKFEKAGSPPSGEVIPTPHP
jgi:hypothetical protein